MVGIIPYPGSPGDTTAKSYIQVETAKFVESTGARNVALDNSEDWDATLSVLSNLNGIVIQNSFNGVYTQDQTFKQTLKNAYKYVQDQDSSGTIFPLWTSGVTALQLAEAISTTQDLSQFTVGIDALDLATTLKIEEFKTPNEKIQITGDMRSAFLEPVLTKKIAYVNQDKGITVESMKNDEYLSSNFEIVATATDRQGTEFIAMLKGKDLPVVLSFVLFEAVYNFYPSTNVPHVIESDSGSTRLTVQFSKAFTNMCRSNDQTYGSIKEEYTNNLYNHKLTTTVGPEYQTFYF